MPLADVQESIARLIAGNRTPSSHLAGAAALHLGRDSLRTSNALDYFHDRAAQVGQAFAADRMVLENAGFKVDVVLSQPGFVRALVGHGSATTKVEWAHDSSWRFFPAIADPVVGFRLHPLDLSINKVLALAGRYESRDFLDVLFVHRNCLSLGGLCWAAVGKDPRYSPEMLVELLARKGRFRPEDFSALDLTVKPDISKLKVTWLGALEDARRLVRALPPRDVGCLYWDPAARRFVTPGHDTWGLVRHFASDDGILPTIGDQPHLNSDGAAQRLIAEGSPPGSGTIGRRSGNKGARQPSK
jgi:hypothetical protein